MKEASDAANIIRISIDTSRLYQPIRTTHVPLNIKIKILLIANTAYCRVPITNSLGNTMKTADSC